MPSEKQPQAGPSGSTQKKALPQNSSMPITATKDLPMGSDFRGDPDPRQAQADRCACVSASYRKSSKTKKFFKIEKKAHIIRI